MAEWLTPTNTGTSPISGGGSMGAGTSDAAEFDLAVNGDPVVTVGVGVRFNPAGSGVQSSFDDQTGGSFNRVVDPADSELLAVRVEASTSASVLFPSTVVGSVRSITMEPDDPLEPFASDGVRRIPFDGAAFVSASTADDPSLPSTVVFANGEINSAGTTCDTFNGAIDSSDPATAAETGLQTSLLVGQNGLTTSYADMQVVATSVQHRGSVTTLADAAGTSIETRMRAASVVAGSPIAAGVDLLSIPGAQQARVYAENVSAADERAMVVVPDAVRLTVGDLATNTPPFTGGGAVTRGLVIVNTGSGNEARVVPMSVNPSTGFSQWVI